MTQEITLIVGVGNPGAEYTETRHNAGFRFLDALLEDVGGALRQNNRFHAQVGRVTIGGSSVWLLAPTTFMNHSGDAVVRFAYYYKIPPEQILVVHDDLDLAPGTVRLKQGGGDGGHNGLRDIGEKLASKNFVRLRIGIGRPELGEDAVDYVLKRAPAAEQTLVDEAVRNALDLISDIIHGRYQHAMNILHTHS
ncbi:MAG: aminoacyl-tRNA hydrolase [Acidiferrobacterales bacterium]